MGWSSVRILAGAPLQSMSTDGNVFQQHVNRVTLFFDACRRKLTARIAELEDAAEQARNRAAKFEKEKIKLQIEIRDLTVELESVIY
jgi:hypothetical protein